MPYNALCNFICYEIRIVILFDYLLVKLDLVNELEEFNPQFIKDIKRVGPVMPES